MKSIATIILAAATAVNADVYLHNPRGSNNRLDEANRDRNNGNRLFDSQNNNRGGANVGQVYFYEGTVIPMEWTNQHTCGNPNNNCEMIIQYTCDERLRDGTTTNTIPTNSLDCYDWDCDTDVRFGRHESWDYYMNCANRERNKGLFHADQNLNGQTARYTRQNPNGGRRGLECPEERDYYPYWGPTPWRDIAILTNQPERCAAYQSESQNVKSRQFCDLPYTAPKWSGMGPIPITQEACEIYEYEDMTLNMTVTGVWQTQAAFGIPQPDCVDSTWSRDNHLGNTFGGRTAGYNWTIPSGFSHERCSLRMRYNISTNDLEHFDSDSQITSTGLTSALDERNGDPATKVDIGTRYGIETKQQQTIREYHFEGNPQVDPFGSLLTTVNTVNVDAGTDTPSANAAPAVTGTGPIRLQLAINTAQFGRTFQDRTFRFAVRARPSNMKQKTIHNLQVRGKRGNIVQTYPGTEYDFSPEIMHCSNGDYIHFQWTGSNTNPNNNAGQGKNGSDRHNALQMHAPKYPEAGQAQTSDNGLKENGQFGGSFPAHLDESNFLGFSRTDRQALGVLDTPGGQFGGELSELDDAGTYFDLGPRVCQTDGVYHYMSTRNNNFSNRSQKAKIIVSQQATQSLTVGVNGGSVSLGGISVDVAAGALNGAQTIVLTTFPQDHASSFHEQEGGAASKFVGVAVEGSDTNSFAFSATGSNGIKLNVAYDSDPVGSASLWTSDSLQGTWTEVEEVDFEDSVATSTISKGGNYVVATNPNVFLIILITVAVLGLVVGVGILAKKKMGGGDFNSMRGV